MCSVDEVPKSWGLIVRTNGKNAIRRKKMAQQREPADVPYGMFMHLMRAQAEREAKSHSRMYEFGGRKISQDDLDERMDDMLRMATERIAKQNEELHGREVVLRDARRNLIGPMKVLATAIGEGYACDPESVTVENVRDWISGLRGTIATQMLYKLKNAEKAIVALRESAELAIKKANGLTVEEQ